VEESPNQNERYARGAGIAGIAGAAGIGAIFATLLGAGRGLDAAVGGALWYAVAAFTLSLAHGLARPAHARAPRYADPTTGCAATTRTTHTRPPGEDHACGARAAGPVADHPCWWGGRG